LKIACLLLSFATGLAGATPHFEPNRGQADPRYAFVARTSEGTAGISANAIELSGSGKRNHGWVQFEGAAKQAPMRGVSPLGGVSHYALNANPSRWIWEVPRFGGAAVDGLYPGIGVSYYTTAAGSIEFDFHLAPHAAPNQIRLAFAEPLRVGAAGQLTSGAIRLRAPRAWQLNRDGKRQTVSVRYVRLHAKRAGLRLGAYDPSLPLTIDPIIEFATFLGGSETESDTKLAVGTDGAIFIAGSTNSADFPASLPSDGPLNRPQVLLSPDIYVSRVRADATAIEWSLFLGGTNAETTAGLRLDDLGNVYVLGRTLSPNFPVTPAAFHTRIHPGLSDLFLVKLDAATGRIKASTFLNAPVRPDLSNLARLAVDVAGGAYVAGTLFDGTFQTTPGVLHPERQRISGGYFNSFAMRLNPALSAAVYSTYLDLGSVNALETDAAGNIVFGGLAVGCSQCGTPPFPAVNPIPGVNQAPVFPAQGYVAKLNSTGAAFVFATLLHGDDRNSIVSDLKLGADGAIHVLGYGYGAKFPVVNPISYGLAATVAAPGEPVPFLARLAPSGKDLLQSTLFYGPEFTSAPALAYPANLRLALLPDGRACMMSVNSFAMKQTPGGLVGSPNSSTRPLAGGSLTCIDKAGAAIHAKTFLPADPAYSEMVPVSDNALLFSGTATGHFAASITPNALQPQFGGTSPREPLYPFADPNPVDAFLMRLSLANPVPKITGIQPASTLLEASISGFRAFDVYGSGFSFGLTSAWNGEPVESQFVDAGLLRLTKIDYKAIHAGENRLRVSMPGVEGGATEAILMGISSTPSNVSVSPSSVRQGAPETKIVIRAQNLLPDSILYWNGSPRAAQYIANSSGANGGYFELLLQAEELAAAGMARVAVANGPPGGGMSVEATFAVLPAGAAFLSLTPSVTYLYSSVPLASKLRLTGSGFTPATRVFWNGGEIPVEFVSNVTLNVQPPSPALVRWGVHDVYAVDGELRSAGARVSVGRAISPGPSAYDPSRRRLWSLQSRFSDSSQQYEYDLVAFDAKTGDIAATISSAAKSPLALVASTDGSYLYIAERGRGVPDTIRRVNTQTGGVDLEWEFAFPDHSSFGILPIPGLPETVVAWSLVDGVYIFDGDRQRPKGGSLAALQFADTPAFATSSRIYLSSFNGACWRWLDFDDRGVANGSPACRPEVPKDVIRDNDLLYFTDEERAFGIAMPESPGFPALLRIGVDLSRRRAYSLGLNNSSGMGLMEFNLDTKQQRMLAQVFASSLRSYYAIYVDADGLLFVNGSSILRIP
jgi:hypothetical protein